MDLAAVREILGNVALKSAFQAFLVTAKEDGYTVREIAAQIGVHPATMYRWIAKARNSKARNPRHPNVETVQRPAGAGDQPCNHTQAFYMGRRRVCLECLAANFHIDKRRHPDDPRPDPVVKPGQPPTRRERRKAKAKAKAQVPV